MIPSQVAGKLLRSGAASGGNNGDNGNGEDLNVLEQFQPNAHNGGMTPHHRNHSPLAFLPPTDRGRGNGIPLFCP